MGLMLRWDIRTPPTSKENCWLMRETKWIVEKIFSLAYQGYGSAKITKGTEKKFRQRLG